jgi:hypothetical protein
MTYGELRRESVAVARALLALGLGSGARCNSILCP